MSESPAEFDFSHYTILIVDDNPINLGVIFDYLKSYGFKIVAARDGESGLKRAGYVRPDIILLDVMMPGIDGFETCRRLKASDLTRDIPVIFMTAMANTEDKVKGFEVGGVDYVTKPLHQEEVLARLITHLRIRDLTRSLQAQNARLQDMTAALSKRALQLETSSQVGRQVTSILDLDALLSQVVNLIQARFGYYAVSIWLLDEQGTSVVLQAGTGAVGESGPGQGLRIAMDTPSVIVSVCKTGLGRRVDDVHEAADYLRLDRWPDTRSELALSLRTGEKTIGVLDVESDRVAAFDSDDQMVLQTLADQIVTAIRNAQLYKSEQYRRAVAESLEQTGRALSSSLDLAQVSDRILEQLAVVVPYARGSVMVRDDGATQIVAQRGFPDDERVDGLRVAIRPGDVFQHLAGTSQPLIIDDVTSAPEWYQVEWLPLHRSWMGVPLLSQDGVIGMISLTRVEACAFSPDDGRLVSAFSAQAAIALENARLYDKINRFNERLEHMVQQRTEELNQAYQTLDQLNKTKSDFIEVAAHELRTPLTLIKGYTQLMGTLVQDNPEAKTLWTGILAGQERLHEIINSMLDVSKITSHALNVHAEPTHVLDIIRSVQAGFDTALQERRLTVCLSDLDGLPPIEADSALLYKLFYHLIVNAIKYTPDGGSITVAGNLMAEPGETPVIEVIVSDTGIGIDPAHHELIFEKFYQTGQVSFHSSGKTKFKGGGPGLGLAIAKGIVIAHGGRIWVESEGYDEQRCPGSHFHVCLPAR